MMAMPDQFRQPTLFSPEFRPVAGRVGQGLLSSEVLLAAVARIQRLLCTFQDPPAFAHPIQLGAAELTLVGHPHQLVLQQGQVFLLALHSHVGLQASRLRRGKLGREAQVVLLGRSLHSAVEDVPDTRLET